MYISRFLDFLRNEKRFSSHTCSAYETDLVEFEKFLFTQFQASLSEVNLAYVRSFVVVCLENGLAESTVGRKLASLRSFYKFLLSEGIVNTNPVILVKAPKAGKCLPVFVEDKKMDQLLDSDIFGSSFSGKRDKLVLELLYGTGIRLAELLQLKQSEIDFYDSSVKVLGKRGKERIVPLHRTLVNVIREYLEELNNQNFNNKTDFLIVTNKGTKAYPKLVYRIVNYYLSMISTQDKKSPHVLRHSFATSLLNKEADLNAIKELLGHSSLAATQVYTHNFIERLKSIYKQAHPKA